MAKSQVATSWHPAAVAMPCISAITGCGIDCRLRSSTPCRRQTTARYSLISRPTISARSWPEENTLPAAARITTRRSRRPPITRRQSINSRISPSERALRRCGRLSVTQSNIAFGCKADVLVAHGTILGAVGQTTAWNINIVQAQLGKQLRCLEDSARSRSDRRSEAASGPNGH